MYSLILTTATRYLMPLMLLFSMFILLRGHNAPGGGFIGGLVAAAAYALYAIAFSVRQAQQLLYINPRHLITTGLLLALLSGLAAPVFTGQAFMRALWSTRTYPGVGEIGTPLLFDLGVYLTVIGVTLMIVFSLAEEG